MTLTDWIVAVAAVIALVISINTYYDGKRTANAANGSKTAAEDAVKEAKRSADAAEQAVGEAKRSADAAEDSVEEARLERLRAMELRDVEFNIQQRSNVIRFHNTGSTTAHKVEVTIYIDGKRQTFEPDPGDVLPGDHFDFDITAEYEKVKGQREASDASLRGSGVIVVRSGSGRVPYSGRISWLSRQRHPDVQTFGR